MCMREDEELEQFVDLLKVTMEEVDKICREHEGEKDENKKQCEEHGESDEATPDQNEEPQPSTSVSPTSQIGWS